MNDKLYSRFFSLQANTSDIQQSIYLEMLKHNNLLAAKIRWRWWEGLKILLVCILALVIFIIESLAIFISFKKESTGKKIFATSVDRNTTNNHLYRMSKEVDVKLTYLILDSPLKSGYWSKSKLDTLWGRTFKSDLHSITTYTLSLSEIITAMYVLPSYNLSIKLRVMCLVRLMRGMSVGDSVCRLGIEKLIFSLSGNACTSMIEKKLKSTDVETVHWLHGVGLGFKFDSFSSITLVNNSYDELFYKNKICGDSLFIFRKDVKYSLPKCLRDIKSIVVYSNLVHSSNMNFQEYGYKIEDELLNLCKTIGAGLKLYWKPHPNCFNVLGHLGDEYRSYIESFGFELLDVENDLEKAETQYISTISTSFIDLISQGTSVFLYDKYGDRNSMFQESIDSRLKFNSSESLADCFNLLNTPCQLKNALSNFRVNSTQGTYQYLLSANNKPL